MFQVIYCKNTSKILNVLDFIVTTCTHICAICILDFKKGVWSDQNG